MGNHFLYYSKFLEPAQIIPTWFDQNLDLLTYVNYFGFQVAEVPRNIFIQEPLLKFVDTSFNIKRAGIIKLDPYRCYNWHKDALRGVCINLSLTPESTSETLFSNDYDTSELQCSILPLKYRPNCFYLFNNQEHHTIFNLDRPRFLFTIEFWKSQEELSYQDVYNWKIVNQL